MWDIPTMTVIADMKKRVVLPSAKPGDRFDVQISAGGRVVLTRLEPVKRKVSYARKGGLLVAVTDTPISWEETRKTMDENP
jgi:DNA-binding IclR family transcriptional regulator